MKQYRVTSDGLYKNNHKILYNYKHNKVCFYVELYSRKNQTEKYFKSLRSGSVLDCMKV